MSHSPRLLPTPGERRARQVRTLLELGFQCVPGPATTADDHEAGRWRITQALPAMGTRMTVTVVDASRDRAEDGLGAAWRELEQAVADLSRHDAGSALHTLNVHGRVDSAPTDLVATLHAARQLHRRSAGAFDVTVLPLVELLRAEPQALHGGDEALREALALVGDAGLQVRGRDIRLQRGGMGITLDGIAKGRVVDRVALALETAGMRHYLIDAGGDIRTAGVPAPDRGWTVAIRDPGGTGLLAESIAMGSGAVATSGSYEIWFDDERTCHHVVSPADGRSPTQLVSVTVTAPTAMLADGLATTAFLLGPDAGPRFIDQFGGCACLMVTRDDARHRSRGWRSA